MELEPAPAETLIKNVAAFGQNLTKHLDVIQNISNQQTSPTLDISSVTRYSASIPYSDHTLHGRLQKLTTVSVCLCVSHAI